MEKKIEIDKAYPHIGIRDGIILSKRGDVTVGWNVTLPPAFRCDSAAYASIVKTVESAISLLPDYTIVHKQDVFMFKRYQSEKVEGFLQEAYERHFDQREYLDHTCRLFLTFSTRRNVRDAHSGISGFLSSELPKEHFIVGSMNMAHQFETMLNGCHLISLERMTDEDFCGSEDCIGMMQDYINFTDDGPDVLSSIVPSRSQIRVGDKVVICHSVAELDQLSGELSPCSRIAELSTASSSVNLSCLNSLASDLGCEHIVNHFILKNDEKEMLKEIDLRRRRMGSFSPYSSDNAVYSEDLEDYLKEKARDRSTLVSFHLNVLSCGSPEDIDRVKDRVTSAMSRCGITPSYNIHDVPNQYWASMPGNASGLNYKEYVPIRLDAALCLWLFDGYETGIPDGNMKLCERQKLVPIRFDIQEKAYKKYIENFNVFILGPSGSGKSFFMNKYLKSCYDAGQHIFLLDIGNSYRGLCNIVREESNGCDGVYYTCEPGKPVSFNPFRNFDRFKDEATEARSFLCTLMCMVLSGKDKVTATEQTFIMESIKEFIKSWKKKTDPVFDDYYAFVKKGYRKILASKEETVKVEYFDISRYIVALEHYTYSGTYGYLLNSRETIDVVDNRFIVFEVDQVKGDDNYPLILLIIVDAFLEKMRKSPDFKIFVIEEAWKALMHPHMAAFIMEIWKVARKHRTSSVVVTQELNDITSSEVVKDTIIANSSVKILLDQSKWLNNFDVLADALALSEDDKSMILSLNRANPDTSTGREVFFNLGNRKSFILRLEVSPEERVAFSSDSVDRTALEEEVANTGSWIEAIRNLAKH